MTPARIPPGSAPGGLVFVLLDADGDEVDRAAFAHRLGGDLSGLVDEAIEAAAETHAERVRDDGGSVVVFDGDTGRPLVLLLAGAVIVLGSPT